MIRPFFPLLVAGALLAGCDMLGGESA